MVFAFFGASPVRFLLFFFYSLFVDRRCHQSSVSFWQLKGRRRTPSPLFVPPPSTAIARRCLVLVRIIVVFQDSFGGLYWNGGCQAEGFFFLSDRLDVPPSRHPIIEYVF